MMNVSENKSFVFFPQIDGEEEQRRFEEGKARYLQNKAKRLADKERRHWTPAAAVYINPSQHKQYEENENHLTSYSSVIVASC